MPRVERKARNQALFRQVNERIAEQASNWEAQPEAQLFICECSRIGCTAQVELPALAYARVREDPTTFLILGGHEDLDHEEVLADEGNYLIVRNRPGPAAEIARETA
jgi:hypothetical protein